MHSSWNKIHRTALTGSQAVYSRLPWSRRWLVVYLAYQICRSGCAGMRIDLIIDSIVLSLSKIVRVSYVRSTCAGVGNE